jgi:hypothetical protein
MGRLYIEEPQGRMELRSIPFAGSAFHHLHG